MLEWKILHIAQREEREATFRYLARKGKQLLLQYPGLDDITVGYTGETLEEMCRRVKSNENSIGCF